MLEIMSMQKLDNTNIGGFAHMHENKTIIVIKDGVSVEYTPDEVMQLYNFLQRKY